MNFDHLAAAASDLALYEVDLTGEICGWTEGARWLTGYQRGEVWGQAANRLFMRQEAPPAEAAATQDAGSPDGMYRPDVFGWFYRKDGSRFWGSQVSLPLKEADGRVKGFVKLVRDATVWHLAEVERDRVFTIAADLIGVAGFDGYLKRINPAFTRVLGHSDNELLSRPFTDFVHPDDVDATKHEMQRLAEEPDHPEMPFENRCRHADGSYRWIAWNSHTYAAEERIYSVGRDVTQQRLVDLKMREYARELERSNGELQQFAYIASHDLQEPLRAVAGCVQMLAERNQGKLDERSVELVQHAVDGAVRMRQLINDLLALSRVGSRGLTKVSVDPHTAVVKANLQLKKAIEDAHATITVGALPQVKADASQLAQLFQNLIANAIKFHGTEPPQIHIEAKREGGQTVFSVRDNGIGISPENHQRIFAVFQRLHSRREYEGTGIGLAICRKIVERHAGRIWVESQLGSGAAFLFALPDE